MFTFTHKLPRLHNIEAFVREYMLRIAVPLQPHVETHLLFQGSHA